MKFEVIQGDCLEVMRGLPAASVDAVVTDPPYCSGGYLESQKGTKAQGLRGATVNGEGFKWFGGDNLSTGGLTWLLRCVMVEVFRVLRPNRPAFMFTDWRMVPQLAAPLESSGLRYRNMIIWDKGNAGLGVGFKPAYEVIMEFSKGTTTYQTLAGANLIRVPRVHASQKEHNAEKPVALLSKILSVAVPSGSLVLDPFCGSGSTGEAALLMGCSFIGIEREPDYADTARRRLSAVEAQRPLLTDGVCEKVTGHPLLTDALRFNQPGNTDSEVPPTVTIRNNGSVAQPAGVVQ